MVLVRICLFSFSWKSVFKGSYILRAGCIQVLKLGSWEVFQILFCVLRCCTVVPLGLSCPQHSRSLLLTCFTCALPILLTLWLKIDYQNPLCKICCVLVQLDTTGEHLAK